MSNIMLDLETMGTGANAAIVAIGAVQFSSKGLGKEFYAIVDLKSCLDIGLTIDASTVMWWLQQSEAARRELTNKGGESITSALNGFAKFIDSNDKIWGNGASFDNAILANAYSAAGIELPWKFWNDRCYRTVKALLGSKIESVKVGTAHNALDDAKSQAEHLVKILTVVQASKQ